MNAHDIAHEADHAFAAEFEFYRRQLWWIDTYRLDRGNFYRFILVGRNDMREGEAFSWRVPSVSNNAYAFALKPVQ